MIRELTLSRLFESGTVEEQFNFFMALYELQRYGELLDVNVNGPIPSIVETLQSRGFNTVSDLQVYLNASRLSVRHSGRSQAPTVVGTSTAPFPSFLSQNPQQIAECLSCGQVAAKKCDNGRCRRCCPGCSYHRSDRTQWDAIVETSVR